MFHGKQKQTSRLQNEKKNTSEEDEEMACSKKKKKMKLGKKAKKQVDDLAGGSEGEKDKRDIHLEA